MFQPGEDRSENEGEDDDDDNDDDDGYEATDDDDLDEDEVRMAFRSPFYEKTDKGAASWQNKQNDCASSEDSDQPQHAPSLIRVFAVCSMGSPGWSESWLGTHAILLVLLWGGSN